MGEHEKRAHLDNQWIPNRLFESIHSRNVRFANSKVLIKPHSYQAFDSCVSVVMHHYRVIRFGFHWWETVIRRVSHKHQNHTSKFNIRISDSESKNLSTRTDWEVPVPVPRTRFRSTTVTISIVLLQISVFFQEGSKLCFDLQNDGCHECLENGIGS